MDKKSAPAADGPTCLLPQFSAEEVHKNILRCFRLRNRVDLKLLAWIKVLHENGFAGQISSTTSIQYIVDNLKYGQSEAYNVLHVALSIPGLPHTASAFERGKISWSQIKPITDIAKPTTEDAWISYARAHTVKALEAKVKEAIAEGKDLPSEEGRGLPNIRSNMIFRFTREQYETVRMMMEMVAAVVRDSRGEKGGQVTPEEVLLFLARKVLASDLFASAGKSTEGARSIYDIVYHVCRMCNASHIHTPDGLVAVPHEHVQEIEGEARKMEITDEEMVKGEALPEGETNDLEIPKDIRRKVLARFGHSCAHCRRKLHLHIHHIIFRCQGGSNEMLNLIPCCRRCHALIHAGTLQVLLDSTGELHWKPRGDRIELLLKEEIEEFIAVAPAVIVVDKEPATPSEPVAPAAETRIVAPRASSNGVAKIKASPESEGAVEALVVLKWKESEARKRVGKALELLSDLGRAPTGDEIVNTALRERPFVLEAGFRTSGKSGEDGGEEGRRPPEGSSKA